MRKKILAALLVSAMAVGVLTACGSTASNDNKDAAATEETVAANVTTEDAAAGDAGFVENEIFSDQELDFINLSAVWFQSVPMENETTSYKAEDADIKLVMDEGPVCEVLKRYINHVEFMRK